MSRTSTVFGLHAPQLGDGADIETAVKPLRDDLEALFVSLFGGPTAAQARTALGVQAHDSDLDAIAALTTTTFGLSLLTQASAAAARTTLGAMAATDGETAFSTYKDVWRGGLAGGSLSTTPLYLDPASGNVGLSRPSTIILAGPDYAGNRTDKLRIRMRVETNAVAPAANISCALVPLTVARGASGSGNTYTSGAALASATATTPGANSSVDTVGADVSLSGATALYALQVVSSAALAAGAKVDVFATLQMHQV